MNIHSIYRPFQKYFRRKRMREFWCQFEFKKEILILDIGGDLFNWLLQHKHPKLVLLNLSMPNRRDLRAKWVVGDGRYLPFNLKKMFIRNFTVWRLLTRPTETYCSMILKEIKLLRKSEMKVLFPDAKIIHERFFSFSKSLIAIKNNINNITAF